MKIGLIIKVIIIACIAIFIGVALLIFCAFQPDRGGRRGCADLTGIIPEKYGAIFIPEGLLPTFSYARYKYSLNASAFEQLKKDITERFHCEWTEGNEWRGASYPGMEIANDTDPFTYYKVEKIDRIVWICYNREKKALYVGIFDY